MFLQRSYFRKKDLTMYWTSEVLGFDRGQQLLIPPKPQCCAVTWMDRFSFLRVSGSPFHLCLGMQLALWACKGTRFRNVFQRNGCIVCQVDTPLMSLLKCPFFKEWPSPIISRVINLGHILWNPWRCHSSLASVSGVWMRLWPSTGLCSFPETLIWTVQSAQPQVLAARLQSLKS